MVSLKEELMARLMQQSTLSLFTFHFHSLFSIFQFEYKYKLRRLASDMEINEMGKQENGKMGSELVTPDSAGISHMSSCAPIACQMRSILL